MNDRASEIVAALTAQGRLEDGVMDLAECALLLAGLDRPDHDLTTHRDHLAELASDVAGAGGDSPATTAAGRAAALSDTLAGRHDYAGDTLTYDDPKNADLTQVIERRRGLPVTLAILYIHAARAQGWPATGLNFPGHFLIRLDGEDGRLILDPFNGGIKREVSDLRALVKQMTGIDAELEPAHYAPIGNRQTLIRLLNNIKLRADAAKDAPRAADIVDRMLMVSPDDLGLLREAGQCHAAVGNLRRAIEALEAVIARATGGPLRHEAEALLRQVRARLN